MNEIYTLHYEDKLITSFSEWQKICADLKYSLTTAYMFKPFNKVFFDKSKADYALSRYPKKLKSRMKVVCYTINKLKSYETSTVALKQ